MPMPNPNTLRKTPLEAFFSIRRINSLLLVVPMLKSPSVARITLLVPSLMKFETATLYASSIPAPPLVLPPERSLSRAAMIFSFRSHEVESSTRPDAPAYTAIATRSPSPSCSTSIFIAALTSDSLLGARIEPDTSSRNTRLLGGRLAGSNSRPFRAIRTRRCLGAHGQEAVSACTANGWGDLDVG